MNYLDSHYFKYVNEREGSEILNKYYGFITYKTHQEECFIVDMFIDKEYRGSKKSKEMINDLSSIAKSKGCSFISAHIQDNDKCVTKTISAAIANGFKIFEANHGRITIIKNLKGD